MTTIHVVIVALGALLGGGGITGFLIWFSARKASKRKTEADADKSEVEVKKSKADAFQKAAKIYQDLNDNLVKELNRERQNTIDTKHKFEELIADLKKDFDEQIARQNRAIQIMQDELNIRDKTQRETDQELLISESMNRVFTMAREKQADCSKSPEKCPIIAEYNRLLTQIKG